MASILKLRNETKPHSSNAAVAFNLQDVRQSADEYLAEVRARAESILQEAEQNAAEILEEARRQGLADAESEVAERVKQSARQLTDVRCRTAIASCETAIERVHEATAEWLQIWREQTVTLAAKMAEKLLRHELSQDRTETLRAWLQEALGALRESRQVRIFVHPDDLAIADQLLRLIARSIPQAAEADVIADASIELGGCVIRTSHGQFDQQLSTQLERLVDQLT